MEVLHLFENKLAHLEATLFRNFNPPLHHDPHNTETDDDDVADSDADANHTEADNDDDDDATSKSLVYPTGRVRSRQVRRIFLLRQEKGEPHVISRTLADTNLILLFCFLQSYLGF